MITVFGSVNIDFVTQVLNIPAPGETVLGPHYQVFAGGKGGNQALAAARAGAQVRIIGAIGDDPFAAISIAELEQARVDTSRLLKQATPTGAAFIAVSKSGENAIIVASGANQMAKATQLENILFHKSDILLVQRELKDVETIAAMQFAKAKGARVILNCAPAIGMTAEWLKSIDILIANEGEIDDLGKILSLSSSNPDDHAQQIAHQFSITVIVTLGADGCLAWFDGLRRSVPALDIEAIDTTAAGDSFCGAFAAALDQGFGLTGALQYGSTAGSLACKKLGAQSSIPEKAAIEDALKDQLI
jgi:ribokinase